MPDDPSSITSANVLGAGSWGTTIADMLARQGLKVTLWGRDESLMQELPHTHRNSRYLPDLELPESVAFTHRMSELKPAELVVFVVPSKGLRAAAQQLKEAGVLQGEEVLLSCTKGVELETGERMSEILGDIFPGHPLAALSGPNHSEEISQKLPTAAVVASVDEAAAMRLQTAFTLPWFRCYTSGDIKGRGTGRSHEESSRHRHEHRHLPELNLGDNAIAAARLFWRRSCGSGWRSAGARRHFMV